jgi:hypothetical protein
MADSKNKVVKKPTGDGPAKQESRAPQSGQPAPGGQKKFTAPEIVILVIIAVLNDLFTVASDFSLAIPILGEIAVFMAEITDFIIFAIVLIWFAFKVGLFGVAGLTQMIGGVTEFIGIPGRTISTVVGIIAVNNPALKRVATIATNPEGAIASGATGIKAASKV